MGYTGMDSWQDSDMSADFVYTYRRATTTKQRRKLIDVELRDLANEYNTPGSVNIALAMEAGIVRKDDLTSHQLDKLIKLLTELKMKSSQKYMNDWADEGNRMDHNDAYKRMLKFIKK